MAGLIVKHVLQHTLGRVSVQVRSYQVQRDLHVKHSILTHQTITIPPLAK